MKEDKKVKVKDLKTIRLVDVDNFKILKFMKEREELSEKINNYTKQIQNIQREQRKCGLKLDRLKEKMIPYVEKEMKKIPTNQWERLTQVKKDKDKIIFEIVNFVESYKVKLLQDKNNGKKH